jgi:hypothetical protein
VGKKLDTVLDTVLDLDSYLKTVDLQNTNAVVVDFFDVGGTFIITLFAYDCRFSNTNDVMEHREEAG